MNGAVNRRLKWRNDDMVAAIADVKDQNLTVTAAPRKHNVPRKTLDDQIKGKVVHGTHPGVSTVLTVEESALVSYIVYVAKRGYPLTRIAMAIAVRSGNEGRFGKEGPSEHWWTRFRPRHPEVTQRKPDKLKRSHAYALNPVVFKQYFELLEGVLDKNGLKIPPMKLYNCDETFVPLDCSREKAVALKGSRNTYMQAQGTLEHITMVYAASAAELPLPPMIPSVSQVVSTTLRVLNMLYHNDLCCCLLMVTNHI